MNNPQYIYLLIEREFISLNKPIYKIGRTNQSNNLRLKHYPKGSILLLQIICSDCIKIETMLIRWFNIKYISRKDIGNEYFEGDYHKMIIDIYDVCIKSLNNIKSIDTNIVDENIDEKVKIIDTNIDTKPKVLSKSIKNQLVLVNRMLKILNINHPHVVGNIIFKDDIIKFRKFYDKNKDIYNYAFTMNIQMDIINIINHILNQCGNIEIVCNKGYNNYITHNIKEITIEKVEIKEEKHMWINKLHEFRYNLNISTVNRL